MKNLLIDIGNSVIKTAEGNCKNNSITVISKKSYSKRNFQKEFSEFLNSNNFKSSFKNIGISSLHKSQNSFIQKILYKKFGIKPFFVSISKSLPLKIEYTETIGNDRICNAVAADNKFPGKNILVIDFGTATTFTLISHKILKGGIISPGILTAFNSLKEKTNLTFSAIKFPKNLIGKSTEENIRSGILFQTLYFCECVINKLSKNYKGLEVIATGGFSEIMKSKTKLIGSSDKELIFKGINLILNYNENNNERNNY